MAGGFFLSHFVIDGPLFDDPVMSMFGLVIINLGVFALLMFALFAVKEGRKQANREARAKRKALKQQNKAAGLFTVSESSSTSLTSTVATSTSTPVRKTINRPMATVAPSHSKNYTRPGKK